MPSDAALMAERRTTYQTLSDVEAARTLAEKYSLSFDSVRGRLSRTGGLAVIKELSTQVREIDPSAARQQGVIARAKAYWDEYSLKPGISRKAAFLSDIHFPYARWDALELVLKILQDFQPDVVSVDNDLSDNDGYSTHWVDNRPTRERLWSADVGNARAVEQSWYQELEAYKKVSVPGNHDNWWFQYQRDFNSQSGELAIAEYMEWRGRQGVRQFSRLLPGQAEPALRLSDNLVWWHGQFVNKNPVLRGKKTIEQFMYDGQASTVVTGHTHRPAWVTGAQMGYHGVNFYNSPCLSRIDAVPYVKRDPREWGLGMVLHEYRQGTRYERGHLLIFEEYNGKLLVQFAGQEYSVKVDKRA